MSRTRGRPLPRGEVSALQTLLFATLVGLAGLGVLYFAVNALTMWLTLATFVGYAIVSLTAVGLSSLATGWTNAQVQSVPAGHGIRVALVTASYVLVQAVLFVAKFVIYDRWVFAGRSRFRAALRSRHRVWIAARANRTP